MRAPRRNQSKARTRPSAPEPAVTACLLSWKRPRNLVPIISRLRSVGMIDEVLVWNNNTELELVFDDPAVRVINAEHNLMCYGRFLCAAQARNGIVYVQDDDVVNHDVAGLYSVGA